MKIHEFVELLQETFRQWRGENITRLGAALAYYAAFSFIPMLIVAVVIASVIFGNEQVESQVVRQIQEMVGTETAQSIRNALQTFHGKSTPSSVTTIFSVLALLYGATGMFRHLKSALNIIWNVPDAEKSKVRGFIYDTVLSFLLVIAFGLLLLIVLAANTVLFLVVRSLDELYPQFQYVRVMQGVGVVMLFLASASLFAVVYRYLPDAHVAWRDVWVGALMTALIFTGGQLIIATVMRQNTIETIYGAASLLIFILVWVHLSSHLVLLGAEFTQVYANRFGSKIIPEDDYQQQKKAL